MKKLYTILMLVLAISSSSFGYSQKGTCKKQYEIKELIIADSNFTIDKGTCLFTGKKGPTLTFTVDETYKGESFVFMVIQVTDVKNNTKDIRVDAKLNSTNRTYNAIFSLDASKENPLKLNEVHIAIVNKCDDSLLFHANMKTLKTGPTGLRLNISKGWEKSSKQGCSKNMVLKGINLNQSGITITGGNLEFRDNSVLNIQAQFRPDDSVLEVVSFYMTLADCKGNKIAYTIPATYNSKSGLFEADFKFSSENTKCASTLVQLDVDVENACGDFKSWDNTFPIGFDQQINQALNGHNRPAQYGQHMIFSGKASDSTKNVKLGDIVANCSFTIDKNNASTALFGIVIAINNTKKDESQPMAALLAMMQWGMVDAYANYTVLDHKRQRSFHRARAAFHSSRMAHYISDNFAVDAASSQTLDSLTLYFINTNNDTFEIPAFYKKGTQTVDAKYPNTEVTYYAKQYFTDACESKVKFESVNASATHISPFYTVKVELTQPEEGDIPSAVILNAEITNCKGEVKYIEIKMTFSTKSKSWTGGFVISEDKSCTWKTTDLTMKVYNQCGDQIKKDNYPKLITKMKDKIAKGDI